MPQYGLGRLHIPDERDHAFPMSSVIPKTAAAGTKFRYWWANGWWGDQGHLPHCVGFSWLHWIEDGPITHSQTRSAGTGPIVDPSHLYREAQKVDQWPGQDYDGTSVRAGAKILRNMGLVSGYRWAWDGDTVVRALLTTGPVVVGTWWHREMFSPKLDKEHGKLLIRAQGEKMGGHAYLINGVNTESGLVRVKNSWGRCFDDQTEILTRGGWKPVSAVTVGEAVATLNHETHHLEYHPVSETHEYDFEGNLWSYTSAAINLVVTPNHRLYMRKRKRKDGSLPPWGLVPANEIDVKHFHMKKDALWEEHGLPFKSIGDYRIPMPLWAEFLGYFISEGHTSQRRVSRAPREKKRSYQRIEGGPQRRPNGTYLPRDGQPLETVETISQNGFTEEDQYKVSITQIKEEHLETIGACLEQLPFTFTRNDKSGKWTCCCKALFEELAPLGKAPEKYIPPEMLSQSREALEALYQAMMVGDGSISKDPSPKRSYYTSSKRLADDFQELLLKTGRCGDIGYVDRRGRDNGTGGITRHIEWMVKVKEKSLAPSPGCGFVPEEVPYQGKVYCVTAHNHIVYVRRNGKACWSGNSWGRGGHAYMPIEDLDKLIKDHGEACLAVEIAT